MILYYFKVLKFNIYNSIDRKTEAMCVTTGDQAVSKFVVKPTTQCHNHECDHPAKIEFYDFKSNF